MNQDKPTGEENEIFWILNEYVEAESASEIAQAIADWHNAKVAEAKREVVEKLYDDISNEMTHEDYCASAKSNYRICDCYVDRLRLIIDSFLDQLNQETEEG